MILQFIERENDTVDLTKTIYCLYENRDKLSLALLENILTLNGIDDDKAKKQLVHEVFNQLNENTQPFKTPIDDEQKIPFIIDNKERPVTTANSWLRYISRRGSSKTWKSYAYALLDFLQFLEANELEWKDVNDDILLSYRITQESLHNSRRKKSFQKLKKKTIQYRLLVVSSFYKYVVDTGYLSKNPITLETITYNQPSNSYLLSHLYSTKEKEQPVVAYSRVEPNPSIKSHSREIIWSWINLITEERNRLIAKIMYQTGIRREEVVLWKVSQIPMSFNDTDEIPENISFEIKGKGGKIRSINLPYNTYSELIRWIKIRRKSILKRAGILDRDHGFVWVRLRGGNPLLVSAINSFFKENSEKHGTKITPHMMRHSFAMDQRWKLYEMGKKNPEKILQQMLGHSSIVTTMTTYGHISPQDLSKESAESLNIILSVTKNEM